MRIPIREVGGSEVLAGASVGRKTLGLLLERIDGETGRDPLLVYLDFEGVDVATASFLRESVLEFRDVVRRRCKTVYPVVANASKTVVEELSLLLGPQPDAVALCVLDESGRPHSPRLLGELQPKQRVAFELVRQAGETNAGELAANSKESGRQTVWNNRLASLSRLGLVMERSDGRAKRYRSLPLGE
ncbi:MAG: hypothetical protein OXK76_05970 [Gammaproteobacteria bacterium]|nr:hypothetical protein [Gammaproteobacteria bacterium]